MMGSTILVVVFSLSVTTALPTFDPVITKLSSTFRYEYVQGPDGGLHLVDTWLKASDIAKAAKFDPDLHNQYHLFTRSNPTVSQPLVPGGSSFLGSSNFNPLRRTIVLIHGFLDSATGNFNRVIVPAYLEAEDVNIVVLDWNYGATNEYLVAAQNAITSGQYVARFLSWINSETGASPGDYHIIGYSLGAQQGGVVSRNVVGEVAYFTGLDPASTWWTESGHKIQPDDALYTEVIHTNIERFGYRAPLADVDFYPNGGNNMPGCNSHYCDHDRAYFFFGESLTSGGFTGQECATYEDAIAGTCDMPGRLQMGGTQPKTGSTGIFHLETNAAPPFSRG